MPQLRLILLVLATTALGSTGSFLNDAPVTTAKISPRSRLNPKARKRDYIVPTEHNQGDSIPLLATAPGGVYVSVGLERSFVGAAITPNADYLLILDIDPNVIALARYNSGLLALARDRADYLELRLRSSVAEIQKRAREANLPIDYREALLSADVTKTFFERIRGEGTLLLKKYGWTPLDFLHLPPPKSGRGRYGYKNANYLYDDTLFAKLQTMAQSGKISAIQVNLTDTKALSTIRDRLKEKEIPLSVLDVSDTWYTSEKQPFSFLRSEESLALWQTFKPLARDESVLLMTAMKKQNIGYEDARDRDNPSRVFFAPWIYFGMTYGLISDESKAKEALDSMLKYYDKHGWGNSRWNLTLDFDFKNNRERVSQNCSVLKKLAPTLP